MATLAGDAAWQARAGAAQALAAAHPDVAVPPLASALRDPHADVRKAAVIALAPMGGHPAAAAALRAAVDDSDADVRAYARHAARASSAQDLPLTAPRPFEDRGNQCHGKVSMIAKALVPLGVPFPSRSWKGDRECRPGEVPEAGVTMDAAPGRRLS